MSEIERIKDQVQRTFSGDAWHGASLLETLNGVTAEKARAKPADSPYSIWEIVLHIEIWEEAIRRRIIGNPVQVTDEQDWRTIDDPGEQAWNDTLAMVSATHQNLVNAIAELSDTDLNRTVKSSAGIEHSLYVSLHGVIHHLLYHTGQIALLKKLV